MRILKHAAAYINARLRRETHYTANAIARAVSVDPWREIELDELITWFVVSLAVFAAGGVVGYLLHGLLQL
jgi:hypothetical protein